MQMQQEFFKEMMHQELQRLQQQAHGGGTA
jgi:hypothetical protein